MTKKIDYSGYSFSFSDVAGDFSGKVKVEEYQHDDGTPNELILICEDNEYNLSIDVANLSSEKHEETNQTTSAAKSLGKLALAGIAGNAVKNKSYGMAGMLASGSQSINTNKTVTESWHNILIQFKDKKILMLNKVSSKQWYEFDDAFKVFTYDEYHASIDDMLSSFETKGIELREKIGSMSGSEKERAFKEIDAIKKVSISMPSNRAEIRKIALERNLVKNLTKEEQAQVDAHIAYLVAEKKKNDEKIAAKQKKDAERLAAKQKKDAERYLQKLEKMSDLEFASTYEYENMSKKTTGIKFFIYAFFTCYLYLIFELRKRSKNKKLWKNIESSDNLLDEFKKFRKTKIKELTTK
ncbi:hypothetical protein OAC11_05620 [Alphaproteobacteria bacterium]|nr:hypothetical protein [Alphaproteobacteria bacterium]